MKFIFLNLKRFDIPKEFGGVNSIAPMKNWAAHIVNNTQNKLQKYNADDVEIVMFFPEAHLIGAVDALCENSPVKVGCQGVFRDDTAVGGNFGAFTTNRTANAAKAIGCGGTIIGHCEERRDKLGIMQEAGIADTDAINRLLNKEIKCAINAGLKVLYCIGETSEEQPKWQDTLRRQLEIGLDGVDMTKVAIAYEPVWAIGPGKTPPQADYIQMIAKFVKEVTNGLPVVYGGGLKVDNAEMLASIPEIDGGLIALTRFSGEIGFYPDEYLEIIKTYLGK
ncbi:triosephosphate isomerase [Hydrogenoanaerobacterium saccharovorans]|uniref:Triosephosphate isomerase n=1 Tax=Hydrogenoanaerobacterium saccharovorans TaxID=474960 RepID=A0A1H7YUX1_9FIRM|nr:triose-phosphate isomerase family protein [Hydrogenoanaerobacterium saccharovorans]RPF49032.1 triosephosphate isomerase [Hydrogenoanaerobacterium saccharovorans]SEM49178.1 triosephosphate isomerase [Hydrogenoanaerobacterium saccharovorans]